MDKAPISHNPQYDTTEQRARRAYIDQEEKKKSGMSLLNASNNAAILVSRGVKPTDENVEMFRKWQTEIYNLNMN